MPDPVCARCSHVLTEKPIWAKDKDGKMTGQHVCSGCATKEEKA
jgi:hypothetical protein